MSAEPPLAPTSDPVLKRTDATQEEFSNYRAISPMAVTSAGAGLLAGLAFVSPMWLIAAGLAIVAGFLADRKIRRMPEILTGRSFAQAGLAMGLIFGITSVAYGQWSTYALSKDAKAFAIEFTNSLNEANKKAPLDTSDVIWYMLSPEMRRGVTPEVARNKMADVLQNSAKVQDIEANVRLMLAFAGKDHPIKVIAVEDAVYHERDGYSTVLLKVGDGEDHRKESKAHDHEHDHAADPKDSPAKPPQKVADIVGEGPEHALLVLHGLDSGGEFRWFVDQIRYPHVPKSFKLEIKKKAADDGHGHDH